MRLQFTNVTKTYTGAAHQVVALADVSFELEQGQFAAVQGASGCGKSTLLLTAGGLMRPDAGRVLLDGEEIYGLPVERRAGLRAAKIGFVFQQFHLVPYLSVIDNILAAGMTNQNGDPRRLRDRATELIDRFGLSDRMHHVPGTLSTGERQRAALARALLNEPELLLADEPTGNLDEENSEVVLNHLADFAAAGGAVLLVTHDRDAAQRAIVQLTMDAGRIVATEDKSNA